jgi:hypothetical protein
MNQNIELSELFLSAVVMFLDKLEEMGGPKDIRGQTLEWIGTHTAEEIAQKIDKFVLDPLIDEKDRIGD